MEVENVKIELLKPHPQNPRVGDVKAIAESIKANGWWGTVVAQKTTNHVLAGNHRILAAKSLDIKEVPVYWVDVDDDQALKILLADNRTNDLATYNEQILADLLQEITFSTDEGLTGTGYEVGDLDDLLTDLTIIDKPEKELIEPPEDPTTKPGDLWIIGNHRLLCGDSTNPQHVERLMDGKKADMVFTDPPYGMDLDTDYTKMGDGGNSYKAVIADDEQFDAGFLLSTFSYCKEIFLFGADYFVETLNRQYPDLGSWIIWDKYSDQERHGLLDGKFGSAFETCWSKTKHKRELARVLVTTNYTSRGDETRVHPTQKPVALAEWFFERWSNAGDLIVDLYGGSGSTLIACEKTSRHCRLMEIDPAYCDVIVKRWEDFTGKTAQTSGNCPESTVKTDSTTPHPNQSTQ